MKKIYVFLTMLGVLLFHIPCQAMTGDEEEKTPILRMIKGKTIAELQDMEATVSYNWLPKTLGNTLDIEDGQLKVTCPSSEEEQQVLAVYSQLNEQITTGYIMGALEIKAESQEHSGARCIGRDYLKLDSEKEFLGSYAIFGSQGNIELTSPKFTFITSFIEVDPVKTTLTFYPSEFLNSPIEYVKITPKRTPLFIQGEIDFRRLLFKDFIISHSDLILQFKK